MAPGGELPVNVTLQGQPLRGDVSLRNLPQGWTSRPARAAVEASSQGYATTEFTLGPVGATPGDVQAFEVVVDGLDPPRRVTAQVLVADRRLSEKLNTPT